MKIQGLHVSPVSLKVHADVLKMAKTEEKRELIKWYHARRVFFGPRKDFASGLALAGECTHEDARFLVSLFSGATAPKREAEAASVFLAQQDDARCLCWAAVCRGKPKIDLLKRSADMGNAWGQHWIGVEMRQKSFACFQRSAAQGEPDAFWGLANSLWNGWDGVDDPVEAERLWHEAAELGNAHAQHDVALRLCADGSLEQVVWLRRAAIQVGHSGLRDLVSLSEKMLRALDGGGSGRIVFEIGFAFASVGSEMLSRFSDDNKEACARCVQLYEQWCAAAKTGVMCWLWLAREFGVAKDMRLLIADLIWKDKTAWSERAIS